MHTIVRALALQLARAWRRRAQPASRVEAIRELIQQELAVTALICPHESVALVFERRQVDMHNRVLRFAPLGERQTNGSSPPLDELDRALKAALAQREGVAERRVVCVAHANEGLELILARLQRLDQRWRQQQLRPR